MSIPRATSPSLLSLTLALGLAATAWAPAGDVVTTTGSVPPAVVAVEDAAPPVLTGLAAGSPAARAAQSTTATKLGLPVEVKTKQLGLVLRLVPAGSFQLGSPAKEQAAQVAAGAAADEIEGEGPAHQVTLSRAFYLGRCEVTQAQWETVMGANPSWFKKSGKDAPVDQVSWADCQIFLGKLCLLEGVPAGTFRLPTEAEWEYACRAGTATATCRGDDLAKLDELGWSKANSDGRTHPVGQKPGNAWGFVDMAGNVGEWCGDWLGSYVGEAATDPTGPKSGQGRIYRGGSFSTLPGTCRAAARVAALPTGRDHGVGLRVVMTVAAPKAK